MEEGTSFGFWHLGEEEPKLSFGFLQTKEDETPNTLLPTELIIDFYRGVMLYLHKAEQQGVPHARCESPPPPPPPLLPPPTPGRF